MYFPSDWHLVISMWPWDGPQGPQDPTGENSGMSEDGGPIIFLQGSL